MPQPAGSSPPPARARARRVDYAALVRGSGASFTTCPATSPARPPPVVAPAAPIGNAAARPPPVVAPAAPSAAALPFPALVDPDRLEAPPTHRADGVVVIERVKLEDIHLEAHGPSRGETTLVQAEAARVGHASLVEADTREHDPRELRVHYHGWNSRHDEWVAASSCRLRAPGGGGASLVWAAGSVVELRDLKGNWYAGKVVAERCLRRRPSIGELRSGQEIKEARRARKAAAKNKVHNEEADGTGARRDSSSSEAVQGSAAHGRPSSRGLQAGGATLPEQGHGNMRPQLVVGADLVGSRVHVWWEGEGQWYRGRVVRFDDRWNTHQARLPSSHSPSLQPAGSPPSFTHESCTRTSGCHASFGRWTTTTATRAATGCPRFVGGWCRRSVATWTRESAATKLPYTNSMFGVAAACSMRHGSARARARPETVCLKTKLLLHPKASTLTD